MNLVHQTNLIRLIRFKRREDSGSTGRFFD